MDEDPFARLVQRLIGQGEMTEDAWQNMNADFLREIDAVVTFAEQSPFPDAESNVEDVFGD